MRHQHLVTIADEIIEVSNENYRIAMSLSSNGEHEKAILYYTKAIRLNPTFADLWGERGSAYLSLDKYDDAMLNYNVAIDLKPKCQKYWNNRGVAYLQLGNYDQAIADFTQAIALDPLNPLYHFHCGHTFSKNRQYAEAILECTTAINIYLGSGSFMYMSTLYNDRGVSHYYLGNLKEAWSDCSKAVLLETNNDEFWNNYAAVNLDLGNFKEAISGCNQALRIQPNHPENWFLRGIANFKWNKFEDAIPDFTEAIHLNPDNEKYYDYRSDAYFKLGKIGEAISDRIEVLKRDSNYKGACEHLYRMLLDLKPGDLDIVKRKALFKAIKKLPLEQQAEIFRICLDENTVLGGHFIPVAENQMVMFRKDDTAIDRRTIASYLDSILKKCNLAIADFNQAIVLNSINLL